MLVVGGGFALFVAVASILYARHKKTYKYDALIIAQVGDGYAVIKDKFKVVKSTKNFFMLKFYHQKDLERTSPQYKDWNFFGFNKKSAESIAEGEGEREKKTGEYTRSELNKLFTRGCIFKKTAEGDIHPVKITEEGDLKVLSQDDRAFSALAAEQTAQLTQGAWDKYGKVVLTGLAILVSGAIFIFTIVYLNTTLGTTIGDICGGAARNSGGLLANIGTNLTGVAA